jgi:hypothetical protein
MNVLQLLFWVNIEQGNCQMFIKILDSDSYARIVFQIYANKIVNLIYVLLWQK